MATTTSRVPALIDYLFGLFANDPTVGGAGVTVYDGPATTAADAPLKLFVGLSDPDSTAAQPAAAFTQEYGGLGKMAKNETTRIHCVAEAWSGDDTLSVVRTAVYGITAAVETLLLADTTQFGGNVLFPRNGFTAGDLSQNNTTTGAIARVSFDLVFQSRIGG